MQLLLSRIGRQLTEFYAARSEHGDSAMRMGWKSREAQTCRFDQLAKLITEPANEEFSVNDLGCGCGDFSEYLRQKGFKGAEYKGFDVSAEMIAEARKLYGQFEGRRFCQIAESGEMSSADYTIASGIFNLKFLIPEHEWVYFIFENLNRMLEKSKKGIAFNMLTKYSDPEFKKDELYYADPLHIFDYCKRNFSKNVALLHDYQEYDFTIVVRKF
jgi:SAM-dependent methyltransferase